MLSSRKRTIILISVILIFIIWGLVIDNIAKNNEIKNSKIEMRIRAENLKEEYETKIEEKRLELEVAVAPLETLSSYTEDRTKTVAQIDKINLEIISLNEALRYNEDYKDILEQKIRCQRAFVVGIEEGDCEKEDIYANYLR